MRRALQGAEPGGGDLVVFRSPGYLLRLDGEAVDEAAFAAEFQNGRRLGPEQAPSDS